METLGLQLFAIVWGACLGSFINVVVYRLPAGLSLVRPPSRCPQCLTRLAPYDNVPILGWLWLGGKCRTCRRPIPWRYPAVEALTAFLCWAVISHFGNTLPINSLVMLSLFVSWLLALALIDLDTETLPNELTQSGLLMGLGYQCLEGGSKALAENLLDSIGGMVLGIWLLSLLGVAMTGILGKEALGGGDPKLSALIGAWLGWKLVLISLFLASCGGLIFAGFSTFLGNSVQKLRFGPFLAASGLLALFGGKFLTEQYLLWFQLGL